MLGVASVLDVRTWRVPNSFIVLCSITSLYLLCTEQGVWGYIKGGTTTLSGGDIYGNKKYGVYNKGTFNMTGGKVRDNDSNGTAAGGTRRDGIYNVSKVNITGGTISKNDRGVSNETLQTQSGTTTVDGTNVNITGNTRGIQNTSNEKGSVTVNNAKIMNNIVADISQSGETFTISGSNTKAKTIELGVKDGKCEVVTLNGVPTEKKTVVFVQKYKDDSQNTKNITVGRPMFRCVGATPEAVLKKLEFSDSNQITLVNGEERKAIMRPCVKTNSNNTSRNSSDYIVLSTKYAGIYKVKNALKNFKFEMPDDADIFWNENNHITMPKLYAWIGGILKQVNILGWLKDGLGNPIKPGEIMSFLFGESNKDHDIVAQMGMSNLLVYGNGQSAGEDYVIEEFNCETDKLPYNTFLKEYPDGTEYNFQAWSLDKDATYQSEGLYQPGGSLDYEVLLKYMEDHEDELTYGSNGYPNVPIYVVWDCVPTIYMADKYWYYSEVRDMTDDEIIEEVKKTTHVADLEDTKGKEERGNNTSLKVTIEGLNRDCFDKLGEIGYTSVRGYVTDGAGNTANAICKIHIVNAKSKNEDLDPTAGPLEASYYTYHRFIDKENYYKTKTVNGKVVPDSDNGALQENSIWYENEEYKKLIEDTLALEGTDKSVVSYEFDIYDLAASKYYCKVHFIGKFWGEDNLDNWYKQFITDAGARVSGFLPDNKKAE